MNKFKNDIFLLAGILLMALFIEAATHLPYGSHAGSVCVFWDGDMTESYALSEDKCVRLSGGEGGYNMLLIRNGRASVSDADCPDKICVRHKEISRNGESIICLPHKLVIQIRSKEEGAPDALTY